MLGSYYLYYELSYCPYTFASFSPYDSGGSPYPGKTGREVVDLLQQGYRMPRPDHVSEEL